MLRTIVGAEVTAKLLKFKNLEFNARRGKKIDKSKVPVLQEADLEEKFIRGTGPGGQKINKSNSCVYLIHKPTGVSVKVQELREQTQNRKIARERLITKLDNLINNECSVENQLKVVRKKKSLAKAQRQRKLAKMKEEWRKSISEPE